MSIRLDIELTSTRPDGAWTWRKAGAKLPKGELDGTVLPSGAKVGDVVRAEAEQAIDGIEIVSVLAPKAQRQERHERIELIGSQRPTELVTTTLAPKGRGRDGDRGRDRGDRGDRPRRDGAPGGPRGTGDRSRGDRPGGDRPRADRPGGPPRTQRPERPKPKRLRPARTHRSAVLNELPPEQQVLAEQVLQGGVPAVRQAIAQQNTTNREKGLPEVHGDELVALAERLLPQLKAAEWQDRADAAIAVLEELDLRDLRSVVVAADTGARDEESRATATTLREALTRRVEAEHREWLDELSATLGEGRVVRALRLSSRPPKAGVPLPGDLGNRLKDAAAAALSPDAFADRWATVLDALAFSPVRVAVVPVGVPDPLTEEFKKAVAPYVARVPHIAELLGIDPATAPKPPKRTRPGAAKAGAPKADAPRTGAPKAGAPKGDAPRTEAPQVDESQAEATVVDGPRAEVETVAVEPVEVEVSSPETQQVAAESSADGSTSEVEQVVAEPSAPVAEEDEPSVPVPEQVEQVGGSVESET